MWFISSRNILLFIVLASGCTVLSMKFINSTLTNNRHIIKRLAPEYEGTNNSSKAEETKSNFQKSNFLDEEWNVNRNFTDEELPQIITALYQSMKDGPLRIKNNQSINTVRCSFNTEIVDDKFGIVKFDLGHVKKGDNVIDAELFFYRHKHLFNATYADSNYLVVRVYQIVPNDLPKSKLIQYPDINTLLNVVSVPILSCGWQVFKVKKAIENWLNDEVNLGFLVTVSDRWENRLYPTFVKDHNSGRNRIILVTYIDDVGDYNAHNNYALNKDTRHSINESDCKVTDRYVDFEYFGWTNFIIAPKTFNARQCLGNCTHMSKVDFNNYGYLFYSFPNQKRPCCNPISFNNEPLMFYDNFDNVIIKIYSNMVVEKCGCR